MFGTLAELDATRVYEEGWQSWSAAGVYPAQATSPRPPDRRAHTMGWRPGTDLPATGFQGEGLLVVETRDGAVAWFSADAASIRAEVRRGGLVVSADGPVQELRAGGIDGALAAVGEALAAWPPRRVGPGWCSWSQYFHQVTADDVLENVQAAQRLELPFAFVQVDDGWQAGIGDWLHVSPRFGDLRGVLDAIRSAGLGAGLWTAPFLAASGSPLGGGYAGFNWGQELRGLDLTRPAALEELEHVYATLREWGVTLHKLDFLYAGALSGVGAYRDGLRAIRRGAGDDAILLGSGAPLLPSIGLVDAMRVGGDVLPVPPEDPDLAIPMKITGARRWMNGRLWVNDPDHLVVRPEIAQREEWAEHIRDYGGLVVSSDRLEALDARGLALTREVLAYSTA